MSIRSNDPLPRRPTNRDCHVAACSDIELVEELLERCRLRQNQTPCWQGEAAIEARLMDTGKLLIIRFPRVIDPTQT